MNLTERKGFEQQLLRKISPFLGKMDEDLFEHFYIKPNPVSGKYPKNVNGIIVNRMLDVDINEGIKEKIKNYGISIRTLRLEKNNRIKQSVSLPNIHFEDIVNESWENSTLKQYLELTRYLFVVLKKTTDFHYKLVGAKFWSITDSELETKVKDAWIETVNTIKHGVELNRDLQTNRVTNNFINASARRIIHVRPRADKSSYMAYNPNADKLPVPANWKNKPDNYSDDWMTRQCFWINNTYIEKQVSDFFD